MTVSAKTLMHYPVVLVNCSRYFPNTIMYFNEVKTTIFSHRDFSPDLRIASNYIKSEKSARKIAVLQCQARGIFAEHW